MSGKPGRSGRKQDPARIKIIASAHAAMDADPHLTANHAAVRTIWLFWVFKDIIPEDQDGEMHSLNQVVRNTTRRREPLKEPKEHMGGEPKTAPFLYADDAVVQQLVAQLRKERKARPAANHEVP